MKAAHDIDTLKWVHRWLRLALLVMLVLLLLIFGPTIESKFFPPVPRFTIERSEITDGGALVSGRMVKARGGCYPFEVSAHAVNIGGEDGELIFLAHPKAVPEERDWHSRPTGPQAWGPWFFEKPSRRYDLIVVRVIHRCHEFWETRTELTRVVAASVFPREEVYQQQGLAPQIKEGDQ